jgi:hypothetical protein
MTTSGSVDFTVTRDDIIQEALEILTAVSAEQTPAANDVTSLARTLNMMVKSWQGRGRNIFTLKQSALFLEKAKNDYTIGGASQDKYAYTYGFTAINGALASGVSSIVVDDATDISDTQAIGIKQSDDTMHWTTVSGAPAGNTVTIADVTTASVADDAVVYFYTAATDVPLRVEYLIHRSAAGTETPGHVWKELEYITIPTKTSDGQTLQGWYDRHVETATMRVWPQSDVSDAVLLLWVHRTAEDFDAAGDNPDFPKEWYWALATNLARRCITKFGTPPRLAAEIKHLAAEALFDAEAFDSEESIELQPDTSGG